MTYQLVTIFEMAVERVLPAYVRQRMILPVLSNAGMVPFVEHNGLAERVTGFDSSTLDRVSVTSQDSVSFELAFLRVTQHWRGCA